MQSRSRLRGCPRASTTEKYWQESINAVIPPCPSPSHLPDSAIDNEFLARVDPHLSPRARALAWFVPAVAALGDQSLQTLCPYRGNEIREAGFQFRRISDG